MNPLAANGSMHQFENWHDSAATRYRHDKAEDEFPNYQAGANSGVTEFYREDYVSQTYDFVLQKKSEYGGPTRNSTPTMSPANAANSSTPTPLFRFIKTIAEFLPARLVARCPI